MGEVLLMKTDEDYSVNEINMGVLHVERIHNLIVELEKLNTMMMMSGQPTQMIELRLLVNWYGELSGVLAEEERLDAQKFLDHFEMNPILSTGTSLLIPTSTEEMMFQFKLWLFDMMYKKNLLTKVGMDRGYLEL
jgi:hypothetical protein